MSPRPDDDQVLGVPEGGRQSERRFYDLGQEIRLEQIQAPEQLAGHDTVDAAVMVRLFVGGEMVEYLECSARTNQFLWLDGSDDVYVLKRTTAIQQQITWLFGGITVLLALMTSALIIASWSQTWWVQVAVIAGGVGVMAVAGNRWLNQRMRYYQPRYSQWARLSSASWQALLAHVVKRENNDEPLGDLQAEIDHVAFGL